MEQDQFKSIIEETWAKPIDEKIEYQNNRKEYRKDINRKLNKNVGKNTKARKNTDYQFTELLVCLLILEIYPINNITCQYIIDFSNKKYEEGLLKCKNKDTLTKYQNDLRNAFEDKKYKESYLENFKIKDR